MEFLQEISVTTKWLQALKIQKTFTTRVYIFKELSEVHCLSLSQFLLEYENLSKPFRLTFEAFEICFYVYVYF